MQIKTFKHYSTVVWYCLVFSGLQDKIGDIFVFLTLKMS